MKSSLVPPTTYRRPLTTMQGRENDRRFRRVWRILPLLLPLAALLGTPRPAEAQTALFDFDTAPLHSPLPLDLTVDGITAHFSATGQGFSIQRADVMGFTPVGFSGQCIYPSSISSSDLLISFDTPLTDISLLYAPDELATDSSCTMRITAYASSVPIGTNTFSIDPPGTWPTGTLSFSSPQTFDRVVVHYDSPPPTGGDYGTIFMVDNLTVTAAGGQGVAPEPGSAALLVAGVGALAGLLRLRRHRRGRHDSA